MIRKRLYLVITFFCISLTACAKPKVNVFTGAMQTQLYFPLLKGHKIGVVANQTSTIRRTHLIDTLKSSGFDVRCVFAPEHGFRGNKSAGEKFSDSVDAESGIKIVSLYGSKHGPSKEDLKDIDLLVFDIQDVGVRFFTYISTLQYCMEACAEFKIPLIVLDRPNPHGFYVDGPVLEKKYSSFVGMQEIPVVYGMTIGEYAKMLNGEGWLKKSVKCDLKVIPCANYTHRTEYVLPIPPSPNLPDMDAIYWYPSICFLEGVRASLGRGTEKPFRYIGYPGFNNENDSSFIAKTISFTPKNIPGIAVHPPFEDTLCMGYDLSGGGRGILGLKNPGLYFPPLYQFYKLSPDKENFFTPFFEKLAGTDQLRKQIIEGKSLREIHESWQPGIREFKKIRKKYLLYTDFEY
jgi:uncharacterized protein YbbC (DUF1343 family)